MPRVIFTANLQRHIECEPTEVSAETAREALDSVFEHNPRLRSYILDDQGALRKHMVIFIDGGMLADRVHLSDAVTEQSEIYVMQALSGG